jgi:hypothetical protein
MTDDSFTGQRRTGPQLCRDMPVVLCCLLGAALSFWMFWRDLNRTMGSFAAPLGTITYKKQAAQRRSADRTLWIRLSRGSPVYKDDYIRTAELSEAIIHLSGEAKIDLAENTLIQIQAKDGKKSIDLAEGNLSIVSGGEGGLRILTAGKDRVVLDPGAVIHASVSRSGTFTLDVLEGSAAFNGQILAAGKSFSTRPEESRAAPMAPPADSYFLAAGETAAVPFSWSRQNYSGPSRLDLALDRRFRRVVQTLSCEGDPAGTDSVSVPVYPGVYWWRVYPGSGTAPELPGGKITVLSPDAPELVHPPPGHVFYGAGKETELYFYWRGALRSGEIPGDYTVEIAPTPDFDSPRLSLTVPGSKDPSISCPGLEPGTWYWRVWESFPGLRLPAAESFFVITPKDPPVTAAPGISPDFPKSSAAAPHSPGGNPAVLREITPEESPLSLPRNMVPPGGSVVGPALLRSRRIRFTWEDIPGANAYIFTLLEQTGQGRRLVLRAESAGPSFTLEDFGFLDRGAFIWQVEGIRREGDRIRRRGQPGESGFTVDFPVPENPLVNEPAVLYGR